MRYHVYANSNTSYPLAQVGGNYNDNANYGFFYLNANYSSSETNGNIGSRHLVSTPALRG